MDTKHNYNDANSRKLMQILAKQSVTKYSRQRGEERDTAIEIVACHLAFSPHFERIWYVPRPRQDIYNQKPLIINFIESN